MQKKCILDKRASGRNEYTKQHITEHSWQRKKLGEQVNQKLLYRESDWWDMDVGLLVVHKARKQGTDCNEYTKPYIILNSSGRDKKKIGEQVNQKLSLSRK